MSCTHPAPLTLGPFLLGGAQVFILRCRACSSTRIQRDALDSSREWTLPRTGAELRAALDLATTRAAEKARAAAAQLIEDFAIGLTARVRGARH